MADSTQVLVDAISASGRKVKQTGQDKYLCQCPGHDDVRPSLSVMRGRGQALTYCFAGCTVDAIAAAVGLTVSDMFDDPKGVDYEYRDKGRLVRTVHRSPAKTFAQSIVDKGVVPLYVPPGVDLAQAVRDGADIFLPEGEKDSETMARLGVVAVSSPMGAGAWAKCDYELLRGRSDIYIVADSDQSGVDRATGLREYLAGLTTGTVSVLHAKVGKDVTDHVVAGLPLSALVPLDIAEPVDVEFEDAVEYELRRARVFTEARKRESLFGAAHLDPKLLADILAMQFDHDWLVDDLLERRDRLILTGGEGAGKSFLSRQIAISAAAGVHPFTRARIRPCRVLVVDAENSEQQWARNARYVTDLVTRGGSADPRQSVLVSAGTRLDFTRQADIDQVHKLIDSHRPDIMYIGPLYKLVPKEISNDNDAAPLIVALDSFRERGVTLLMEAHAGHGKGAGGDRDLRPRGSAALMGWPEFGFGLRPLEGDDTEVSLVRWRGDREQRDWPKRLRRGVDGEMPWMPVEVW